MDRYIYDDRGPAYEEPKSTATDRYDDVRSIGSKTYAGVTYGEGAKQSVEKETARTGEGAQGGADGDSSPLHPGDYNYDYNGDIATETMR